MISQDDWNRLARLAAGECTAEEAEELARWIDEAAERQEALAFIRDVGGAAEAGQPRWDTAASWERLVARRSARARPPLRLTPPASTERRVPGWRRPVAAAAAVLVAAGSLVGAWQLLRTAAPQHPAAPGSVAGTMREYVTPRGQRATFQLPDGSRVMLGVASRLRYPASFGVRGGRRDVYLEGQALFEVEHDERRPFLVHTRRAVTEDLGTKFTMQEYPGDTAVQVVVAAGSVELRAQGRGGAGAGVGALLRPGQLGLLASNGDALVRSDVDLAHHLAWTEGRLVFEDTPLRDVLPQLSRWYDLEFVLGDSVIGARSLTTSLAGEAIAETLKLLSSTLDIDYEWRGRTVVFLPRGRTR